MALYNKEDLQLWIYDRSNSFKGICSEVKGLAFTRRCNATDSGFVEIATDNIMLPYMTDPGATIVVRLRGQQFMAGSYIGTDGYLDRRSVRRVYFNNPFDRFHSLLAWPSPGAAINAQTGSDGKGNWLSTGKLESVWHHLVTTNWARINSPTPMTFAANQDRGPVVTISARFTSVWDEFKDLFANSDLQVRIDWNGAGWTCSVREVTAHQMVYTLDSGIVAGGTWSIRRPEVTRTLFGGDGQDQNRLLWGPTIHPSDEGSWRFVGEKFVDGSQVTDPAIAQTKMDAELAAGGAVGKADLKLTETEAFSWRQPWEVGDRLKIEVEPGIVVEEQINEAVLAMKEESGSITIEPMLGQDTTPPAQLAKAMAGLARRYRQLSTR